ncbi:DNA-3-methyladenine glycosylase 2 family protein [Mycolicibacterium sp.]|uniref:DNA-3-methyladenine glycosylase family protein n=1 Tax=Mycolicibacterium sp. TaxID=2320850 RepID=UPI0028ADABBB|nr:DNA-3-methyladenine glycosylase 2 family protein [Mycolicibacterium sp.]
MLRRTVTFPGPASPGHTLAPQRRGPGDPTFQIVEGDIWRTSLQRTGPVTARLTRTAVDTVECQAWGDGAQEFTENLPALLGADDDAGDFSPEHPVIAEAWRRVPHLRLGRTGRVLEAMIPAVIEQRVQGVEAFRSWRLLVTRFGTAAPGPAPERLRVAPSPQVWRSIPSWEYHRANVDPGRMRTIVGCAQRADALERQTDRAAFTTLPGVGVWTAAETAQRALGDADALSVGDYHLASMIGWTLLGSPIDDDAMVELLEPLRPHRYRAVRLLEVSRLAQLPRRGPRLARQRISGW